MPEDRNWSKPMKRQTIEEVLIFQNRKSPRGAGGVRQCAYVLMLFLIISPSHQESQAFLS